MLGEVTEEQDTNINLSHSHSNLNENISSIPSTRGESFDSLLGESDNVSTTTTHSQHTNINDNQQHLSKISPAISTRGESYDSLRGESTNVSAKTKNSSQQNSILAFRISTRGESSNSLLGEPTNNEISCHEAIESLINKNNESIQLLLEEKTEPANKSNKPTEDRAQSTRGQSSGSLRGARRNKEGDYPNDKKGRA